MLFLFYSVSRQLQKQPDWKNSLNQMLHAAIGKNQWKFYSMFGLMCVNWALESLKWQIAMKPVQSIGFIRSFKAVLAGTCIASFTPNRVGDYLGRMLFVAPGNKILSVTPTILSSMSQMLITGIAGSVGIYLYSLLPFHMQTHFINPAFFRLAMVITMVAAAGLGLIYLRFDPLVNWLKTSLKRGLYYFRFNPAIKMINNWMIKNRNRFSIPLNFSLPRLATILGISAVRYVVFILQYFLLFSLFGIALTGKQVFTGVSVMFVVMSLVPTLTFLTDLGFRWAVGIQIFQVFTTNTAGILAVSLGIWFINLIIPALVGSLLILRIKFFSSR
jgi:hypothetical protein